MESVRHFLNFLQDVWREVHPTRGRVTWPTAKAVRMSTAIVIAGSVLMSLYITICDGILRLILLPR
jgi:preprotein translocase SecE subunit